MTASDTPGREILPLQDLPMYWQGRCNAFRLLQERRVEPDQVTLAAAETYEECATELRAALTLLRQSDASADLRVVDNDKDEINVSFSGQEIRGWSYDNDDERRHKMLQAHEFAEGWFQAVVCLAAKPADDGVREASERVVKVWQEAPYGVSFGSFMERACGDLAAALSKAPKP